jgi:hypothetical protein
MATTADAQLILSLYDLRRESVCREARAFFIAWKPTSAEEVRVNVTDMSRQDNAWVRQATSYWEMAFSLVNTGAVDEALFAKNCGEGLIFAVKCQSLKARFPEVWTRTMAEAEAFIARNEVAQQKVEMFKKRFGF